MPDNASRRKVLVVDDNPATLYSTSRVLRSAGYVVQEAENGTDALRISKEVDLVVLDVNLPDINGFEVCRRIRSNERTRHTPVIHLSASFVNDTDKVYGLEMGADGYLTHPVEPPVLIATVNAFLRARSAEDDMKRNQVKFKAVFENAVNGIALIGTDLTFLEINPSMCRLLDRRGEEITGRRVSDFMPHERQVEFNQIFRELEGKGSWHGAFPVMKADGSLVHLEWNMSIHSDPDVRLAIVNDITDRLRTEREREQLLGSERAARSEAEKANRLKDDFLATLSHELRTPLNAILGWSQMLRRQKMNPAELEEGIAAIERNAKVQTQLISDLLDVSRITSGKLRLDVQSVDPAAMVESALASISPAAEAKGIRIIKLLNPYAGPISGDPSRLQQVMWNLVNNAVKFTPKDGQVQVKLERVESHVSISVADNGKGIPPELLPYVFERFRQGDASTTRDSGGLGLGLAIAKHLVEMHGGRISAHSEGNGKGATFIVSIPLSPIRQSTSTASRTASTEVDESVEVTPSMRDSLKGLRVLIVDDDADARLLMKRILADSTAEVTDVGSADDALEAIDRVQPHVLISDIGMPFQDGYDLIRQVRARGHTFQKLPALALTAFARSEDRRRALLAGFQAHVAKPVDARELIAAIAALVGRTGQ